MVCFCGRPARCAGRLGATRLGAWRVATPPFCELVRTNFSLGRSYTLGLGLRFFLFRTGDSLRQPPGAPPPSSGRGSLFRVIRVGHFCMFSDFAFFFSSSHSNVPCSGDVFDGGHFWRATRALDAISVGRNARPLLSKKGKKNIKF